MNADEDDKEKKLRQARKRKERYMARQSDESLSKIRANNAECQRRRKIQMTSDELHAHRAANTDIKREPHIDNLYKHSRNGNR